MHADAATVRSVLWRNIELYELSTQAPFEKHILKFYSGISSNKGVVSAAYHLWLPKDPPEGHLNGRPLHHFFPSLMHADIVASFLCFVIIVIAVINTAACTNITYKPLLHVLSAAYFFSYWAITHTLNIYMSISKTINNSKTELIFMISSNLLQFLESYQMFHLICGSGTHGQMRLAQSR